MAIFSDGDFDIFGKLRVFAQTVKHRLAAVPQRSPAERIETTLFVNESKLSGQIEQIVQSGHYPIIHDIDDYGRKYAARSWLDDFYADLIAKAARPSMQLSTRRQFQPQGGMQFEGDAARRGDRDPVNYAGAFL